MMNYAESIQNTLERLLIPSDTASAATAIIAPVFEERHEAYKHLNQHADITAAMSDIMVLFAECYFDFGAEMALETLRRDLV